MSYDTGTISRPNIIGSTNQNMGSSIDISFDSEYYFVGSCEDSSNTGQFDIFKYIDPTQQLNANTFTSALYTITGSSIGSKLGFSVKSNWDGTRVVVGEPGSNHVRVITTSGKGITRWDPSTITTALITSPDSGSDNQFGYSVAISKDTGNDIVIGAPGINKIYVFQINSASIWINSYENSQGSTLQKIKYDANTYYDMVPSSNSFPSSALSTNNYGHSVDITPDATHIVAGAPGNTITYLHNDNCVQIPYTFRAAAPTNNPPISELPHTFIDRGTFTTSGTKKFEVFGSDDYLDNIATLGWVRALQCPSSDWSSTVTQLGSELHGDTEDVFIENSYPSLSKHVSNVSTFDYTALGSCVRITPDGDRLIAGSPRYSVDGTGFSAHLGKIETWLWNEKGDVWDKTDSTLIGPNAGGRMGETFNIDYQGDRLAVLYKHPPNQYINPEINPSRGAVHVFDWSGDQWYEISPQIFLPNTTDVDDETGEVAICGGDIIVTGCTGYNSVTVTGNIYTHSLTLTQSIKGNTIVGGYLSADTLYVGTNDGSTDTSNVSTGKKIQFGGTYSSDDNYASATIQNRTIYYDSTNRDPDQQGFSELLLSKRFTNLITNEGALDQIRIKAPEFHIDEYMRDDLLLEQKPAMTKNALGDFKFNPEFIMPHECASANIKAKIDIEGDAYIRRRLNAGNYSANHMKGIEKLPYRVFYDTRNREVIKKHTLVTNLTNGDYMYSNVNTQSTTPGPGWGRYDTRALIEGNVEFDSDECAIQFGNAHSRIYTTAFNDMSYNDVISANQNLTWKCSFWLKLTQTQSVTASLGGGSTVTLIERVRDDGTTVNGSMIKVQMTSSPIVSGAPTYGLLLNFGTYILAGNLETHVGVGSDGFKVNQWYHIHIETSSTFDESDQIVNINGSPITMSHVGTSQSPTASGTGSFAVVGNAISGLLKGDKEGDAVDINSDGEWLISGAWKASTSTIYHSGQVRTFQFIGGKWNQIGTVLEGDLKNESFGYDVGISDMSPIQSSTRKYPRIIVSAKNWDSNKGRVKVFFWDINGVGTSDGNWVQMGSSFQGTAVNEYVGESVSISKDGTTIAIGRSTETTIHTWNGQYGASGGWTKKGTTFTHGAGTSVSLTNDGSYVVIGTLNSGVGVWHWNGSAWTQRGSTITGVGNSDIGVSVDISSDGQTVVLGQPKVTDPNTSASSAGKVQIYTWDQSGNTWTQRGSDIYGAGRTGDLFGQCVTITDNGERIMASTDEYDGVSNTQFGIGHARGFDWDGSNWVLTGYQLVGDTSGEHFGSSISISGNGRRIAIGSSLSSLGGSDSGKTIVYSYAVTNNVQTWAVASKMVIGGMSGDSIQTAYIGMVGFETYAPDISEPIWVDPVDNTENRCNHPTYLDFYNYGAPSEKLTVGGDVKIEKDLRVDGNVGIGTETPQTELDVNGYITHRAFTFFVHSNGGIWSGNTPMMNDPSLSETVAFDSYPGTQLSTKGYRNNGADKGIYFAPTSGVYFINAKCRVPDGSVIQQDIQWYIRRINTTVVPWDGFEAWMPAGDAGYHRQHQSSTYVKLAKGEGIFPRNSLPGGGVMHSATFGGHFIGV